MTQPPHQIGPWISNTGNKRFTLPKGLSRSQFKRDDFVEVQLRNGSYTDGPIGRFSWDDNGDPDDIIRFRLDADNPIYPYISSHPAEDKPSHFGPWIPNQGNTNWSGPDSSAQGQWHKDDAVYIRYENGDEHETVISHVDWDCDDANLPKGFAIEAYAFLKTHPYYMTQTQTKAPTPKPKLNPLESHPLFGTF